MKIEGNPFRTIVTIVTGFLVAYLATEIRWFLFISLGIGLIGVFSELLSGYIHFVWNKLAWVLALIVPNILLGGVFYLLLFPIALLSRLVGKKDPLQLKNTTSTLFKPSKSDHSPAQFERSF